MSDERPPASTPDRLMGAPSRLQNAAREHEPQKPAPLTLGEHAKIAAALAVRIDEPRRGVLVPFKLSEAEWEVASAEFTQRIVDEIRTRAGSGAPIEERYPLSTAYAKAYADALRDVRNERNRGDEEATLRIPPGTPLDEPLSLLGASNRAAAATKRAG